MMETVEVTGTETGTVMAIQTVATITIGMGGPVLMRMTMGFIPVSIPISLSGLIKSIVMILTGQFSQAAGNSQTTV